MRAARAGLVVTGVLLVGFGLLGFVLDANETGPVASWVSLAAAALLHDLLLAPVVVVLGIVVTRVVPAAVRPVVQAALLVSGVLVLVALPLVLGLGRRADDPSALPLDYGRNLALLLLLVWLSAGLLLLVRRVRRRQKIVAED